MTLPERHRSNQMSDCELDTAAEPFDEDPELVFDALSEADRRFLVAVLVEDGGAVSLEELARRLAARERDERPADLSESAVESSLTALYHSHVPKLADAGVVNHDRESGTVALAADPEVVRERVELPSLDD